VALRPDGTYWVVDGQQRVSAAEVIGFKSLPCRIIPVDGSLKTEAWLFIGFNTGEKSVRPYDLYVAAMCNKVPDALFVAKVVKKIGYRVGAQGDSKRSNVVTCVAKMRTWARKAPALFEKSMYVASKIHNGSCIDNRVINGLCTLEEYFQTLKEENGVEETITDPENIESFVGAGEDEFFSTIDRCKASRDGNNASRPQANAFISILNDSRPKKRRIPPML